MENREKIGKRNTTNICVVLCFIRGLILFLKICILYSIKNLGKYFVDQIYVDFIIGENYHLKINPK